MEVILKKDMENLGLEFDLVNVKPGYARNFLIPEGIASLATPKNIAELETVLKEREATEKELVSAATATIDKLKKVTLTMPAKVGTGDKLFGSINNADLVEALEKQGVSVDKKYVKVPGSTIKRTGKYTAKVRLHRTVEYDFPFEVVSDGKSEEA